jgi:homoserine dehydrogenase
MKNHPLISNRESPRMIKTALLGLGNVNIGLLKIFSSKRDILRDHYELDFLITAVADSSGIAIRQNGFSYQDLIDLKAGKGKVSALPGFLPGISSEDLPHHADAELLIESSPVNLVDGNPGLTVGRTALQKGWKVVFANKAPLVFAFDELHALAKVNHSRLAYSATVCGGLPVINVLKRDMAGARLKKFSGIVNATTNHILKALATGGTMDEAIAEAQRVGAAEADPMHDVKGHDAANKLFIIMKSFTGYTGTIKDIETQGIQNITASDLAAARQRGNTIKLIASAQPVNDSWKLSVKPVEVKAGSFLGQCEGWEMGIEFKSDLYESISMKIVEEDPLATSAAVLRDAIEVMK